MSTTQPTANSSARHLKKTLRLFAKVIIGLLLFIILLFILIQTPPVQNFARKKIQAWLSGKLKTEVSIGKLYVGFPNSITLQNVYVEDLQNDTLLYGGRLAVDISLFKLLKNEVEINEIQLEQITAKIKRQLPDTTFNFQFIVDAFAPRPNPNAPPAGTTAMKMAIRSVLLDKVRVIYKDVITGNDMDVWVNDFTTRIDVFDPAAMTFDIPDVQVNGIRARIYQSKPLVSDDPLAKDMQEAQAPIALNLNFNTINLQQVDLEYRNDVSGLYNTIRLGRLEAAARRIDLPNMLVELDKLHLDNTNAYVRLDNKQEAKKVTEELGQEIASQAQNNWRIQVKSLQLNKDSIRFDDNSKPRLAAGMDYAHLDAKDLTFHAEDFQYSRDSVAARITRGSFTEKSGFQLRKLQTNFLFAAREAYLEDLLVETPGTRIARSVRLQYPSLDALSKNPGSLRLDAALRDTRLQVKDMLTFAPQLRAQPAFSNPAAVWLINGSVSGTLASLRIPELQFRGLRNTRLDISGSITGLPDVNRTRANLTIRNLVTSRTDLALFIPPNTLPSNITLPETISVNGTINGGMQDVTTSLAIGTSLGNATIKGRIQQATDPEAARYNVSIGARGLQLGRIMQDTMYGTVSADITANGRGFDPSVAEGSVKGTVHSAVVKNYTYRNVKLEANMANKRFTASTSIHDPNIDLTLNASGTLTDKFPAIKVEANIDSIKTQSLNLTPNLIVYRGRISGDFSNTDPDDLAGRLLVTHSVMVSDQQRFQLDTLAINAGRNDTGRYLRLTSDVAWVNMAGEYKLTELGTVFQNLIQPHFALVPGYQVTPVSPYDFTIDASILDKPLWKTFMPELKRMESLTANGRFSSTAGWSFTASSPMIEYGTNRLDNLNFTAGSSNNGIAINTTIGHLTGGGMNIFGTAVDATVANNEVNLALNIKDRASRDKYRLAASFTQPSFGTYVFRLRPQQLLLNYDPWDVQSGNAITITEGGVNVNNFVLSRNGQRLSIASNGTGATAPINVNFSSFRLGTITGFVQADTNFVDGVMNGSVVLNDVMTTPTFTSDLTINDLSVQKDTLGNATIRVNNNTPNVFNADVRINGRGNDIQLGGQYFVKPGNNSSYDLVLDVRQLQLSTVEGLSMGNIRDASGTLSGRFTLNGTLDKPNINGELVFNQAALNVVMLNSKFTIDQERVQVNNRGISLQTFTIRDETGNAIVIDGDIATTNFINHRYNLNITANNFRASNTTKKDNNLFYGQLFLNTRLRIRGTEELPVVDGSLAINKETDFTVVLPQPEPGLVDREGVIAFVDMDAPRLNDSVFATPYMAMDTSTLKGFDVNVNIEVNREATLNLVVDAGNGDFVRMKGEGLINGGIDPSGKITLSGSYELEEGSYELTFNFLRRKFNIQKGSKIIWQGEPTDANVDVTAIYVANTSPLDLVDDQLAEATTTIRNTYRQRLPFEVHLRMQGQLMKPLITFDIILPDKNYNISNDIVQNVEVKLEQLRQEPAELNKQVFALLLLNRFVGENPFVSSGSSPFDAGSFARQSASKLLTEQLNRLAENLIEGVDLNFDVNSIDDYTTGERRNRTDFNVSLSKNLLSDRLRVTVGSNFEIEGPQQAQRGNNFAGDLAIDYKLSKDGRYLLRGYRKNQFEGVVEGYVVETGLSFIITLDYNRFMEIFRKRRRRNARPQDQPPATQQNTDQNNIKTEEQPQNR